ncbi:coiled-coil domain-containing protein 137 [Anolis carolinensis]|uniref:coiled-coil domain-containing protein 137 n=1 Tax=Anolis carolinensis TaxID=28377 RepID=UPI002F2B3C27
MGKARSPAPTPRGGQMKKKIDSKPKCLDDQEIPYRLREIMKSREELKKPKTKKKKKLVNKETPDVPDSNIPVPKFRRRKGEAAASYMRRMERETQHVWYLTKNQLQREPEKEEVVQKKSQKKKEFQQKKMDKIRKQKEEKKAEMLEKELFKDSVKFGDFALQPPTLTAKPKKSKDKAGQRQLLLTSLFSSGSKASTPKTTYSSLARQRIVQEERERVVKAYRDIKKQKQQQKLLTDSKLVMDKLKNPA